MSRDYTETDNCSQYEEGSGNECLLPPEWLMLHLNSRRIYPYCGKHKSIYGAPNGNAEAWVIHPRHDEIAANHRKKEDA